VRYCCDVGFQGWFQWELSLRRPVLFICAGHRPSAWLPLGG
jgi:hypothetical protein